MEQGLQKERVPPRLLNRRTFSTFPRRERAPLPQTFETVVPRVVGVAVICPTWEHGRERFHPRESDGNTAVGV